MVSPFLRILLAAIISLPCAASASPIRVLFLGHEGDGPGQGSHRPREMHPRLAMALGREAIYFDYVATPEAAFGDRERLFRYDAVLLYANHQTLDRALWQNLRDYVEQGGGFVAVHSASWCFQN